MSLIIHGVRWADSGAPNPAPLSVTFGWTYILTSLYTPSLGAFFKTQITNYTLALFTTNPSRNLLQDLGCICTASYVCDPCTASVTTGSDSSNHLTVSITLNGVTYVEFSETFQFVTIIITTKAIWLCGLDHEYNIMTICCCYVSHSDPPALVGGATNPTGADSVSLADALRYEVFVSGLFTNPKVATYLQVIEYWYIFTLTILTTCLLINVVPHSTVLYSKWTEPTLTTTRFSWSQWHSVVPRIWPQLQRTLLLLTCVVSTQ